MEPSTITDADTNNQKDATEHAFEVKESNRRSEASQVSKDESSEDTEHSDSAQQSFVWQQAWITLA
jgi:hypothetical protein